MEDLLSILGFSDLSPAYKDRLAFSCFCWLVSVILAYFWFISLEKIKAAKQDGKGLVYLAFAFLLYGVIGFVSVYKPTGQTTLLIISGLISCCFLSSLSYFSSYSTWLDKLVGSVAWKNGIKYLAFCWIILITLSPGHLIVRLTDIMLAVVAIGLLGFSLSRYFWKRQLKFISFLTTFYFLVFICLQFYGYGDVGGGKFVHINTVFLTPAMVLSLIVLAFTFNWINELNFYELSAIWTHENEDNVSQPVEQSSTNQEFSGKVNRSEWVNLIATDELESLIREVIIYKKHRHESLEEILNIASRNTRNNNQQLKDTIRYEDYQLSRNKVSSALLRLIEQ